MKDRIARTKQFVHDHSHKLATVAGVAVGAAVTYKFTRNPTLPNLVLNATTDQLNQLLSSPGSWIEFPAPGQTINLVVDRT